MEPLHEDTDDEGMGDEEEDLVPALGNLGMHDDSGITSAYDTPSDLSESEGDSGDDTDTIMDFASSVQSSSASSSSSPSQPEAGPSNPSAPIARPRHRSRHSAPAVMSSSTSSSHSFKPNYKLLHQTHIRLYHRFLSGSYRISSLQTRGTPNSHTNTIYCLQLYTYPDTGTQVLFTGSKDRTVKEWDLSTGEVIRTIEGVHEGSILSICVYGGYLASAGSDWKVAMWDLREDRLVKVMRDHEDSVLCVRFDEKRLVSCSKGGLFGLCSLNSLTDGWFDDL